MLWWTQVRTDKAKLQCGQTGPNRRYGSGQDIGTRVKASTGGEGYTGVLGQQDGRMKGAWGKWGENMHRNGGKAVPELLHGPAVSGKMAHPQQRQRWCSLAGHAHDCARSCSSSACRQGIAPRRRASLHQAAAGLAARSSIQSAICSFSLSLPSSRTRMCHMWFTSRSVLSSDCAGVWGGVGLGGVAGVGWVGGSRAHAQQEQAGKTLASGSTRTARARAKTSTGLLGHAPAAGTALAARLHPAIHARNLRPPWLGGREPCCRRRQPWCRSPSAAQ